MSQRPSGPTPQTSAGTPSPGRRMTQPLDIQAGTEALLQELDRTRDSLAMERANVQRLSDELMLANQRMEQQALTDHLTGLPNRRFAVDRLDRALLVAARYGRPLALILVDVVDMAKTNATFGSPAGDVVLKSIASAVRSAVRVADDVARFDGDAFLVICHETTAQAAASVAGRLLARIAGLRVPVDQRIWSGRACAGVVELSASLATGTALLQALDGAALEALRQNLDVVTAGR